MKQPGERLGPYEIVASIGKGAMAEVYRARDVRLRREVALKVLSGPAAADDSFLVRFEREARSASAIDHPNVVTVHDVGRFETSAWIALELVEGRTLREVLEHGKLPLRRALSLAAQIADGLAAAHERDIVHRDLKPENIKVTPDGLVKILDFGLAKVADDRAGVTGPAGPSNLTTPGILTGTVLYMSPEQAAGKPVDFRSDQFALGDIVFEMLAGRAPFLRDSVATTLFAIVREDPAALSDLDPAVRVPLRWILDRCLAKEPEGRYGSTRDLARDLHRLSEHLEHPAAAVIEEAIPERARRVRTVAVPLALSLAALVGFVAASLLKPDSQAVPAYEQLTFGRGHVVSARFMPDGQSVVYSAGWEGKPFSLYRKDPQGAGSPQVQLPPGWLQAVSAKGTALLVASARIVAPGRPLGMLGEAPLDGGDLREVRDEVQAADWDAAGEQIAVVRELSGKTVLEFPRGRTVFATAGWISFPRVCRSRKVIAFAEHPSRADDRGHVAVVDYGDPRFPARALTRTWGSLKGLAWGPREDEVWFAASPEDEMRALRAVSLDEGEVRVLARAPGPLALLDVAGNGDALVARETRHFCILASMPDGATRELSWLDSSLLADLSDDGRAVLFTEFGQGGGGTYSTFLRAIHGVSPRRLGAGFARALSPDGRAALSIVHGDPSSLVLLPTGPGDAETLNFPGLEYQSAGFVPDGRILVAAVETGGAAVRLYVQDRGGKPRLVSSQEIDVDHYQGFPVSPDGKWVATIGRGGELAVRAIERDESKPLRGLPSGSLPIRWSGDGRGLFVFRPDEVPARIMRVDVATATARLWLTVAPPDVTGVHFIPAVRLSADGRTCVYSYARYLTVLYRAKGLH